MIPSSPLAPRSRKATVFQLVFMTYAVICSGAYGLEEMVSAAGPGLTMLLLTVLPLVYAAPVSLTCTELAARFPIEGGYYRWVRMAFGDFAGYTPGWLVWLTMFATNASFAVLFCNYLRYVVPDLSPAARFFVAAALVWAAVVVNCYLLIYAALFKLRGRPSIADRPGFRIPLGTAGLCAMVAPSVFIVLVIVRQGLFPGGRLDLHQALIDLALFDSGPLTYLLARVLLVRREVPA